MPIKRNKRMPGFLILILTVWALPAAALAAQAHLSLYIPFDGNVNARVAQGKAQGKFLGKPDQLHFAPGISGKGLITGGIKQAVRFSAPGNINPEHWTITFWVKALKGAGWHTAHLHGNWHQEFWQLFAGHGASTRFYKYGSKSKPWLLSIRPKGHGKSQWIFAPNTDEQQWHFWAVTWRRGAGASIYLDGHRVAQDASFPSSSKMKYIVIGQNFGLDKPNKIIDEFKIYDGALSAGQVAEHYYQEADLALKPVISVGPALGKITIDGKITKGEWQGAAGFTGLIDKKNWAIQPPVTWGRIAYDDHDLYLAMHSNVPADVKNSPDTTVLHGFLKNQATQHDGLVSSDDSFFLFATPNFPNGTRYRFYVNSIGTTYDYSLPAAGGVNLGWESKADVKSVVNLNGWSMEARIPLKVFGINHITPGKVWHMDFGRIWKMLLHRTDVWAPGKRIKGQQPSKGSSMGVVRFVGKTGLKVDLSTFDFTPDGDARVKLNLFNGNSTSRSAVVHLLAAGKTLASKKVSLGPGGHTAIEFDTSVQKHSGQLVAVNVESAGQVIFHQAAPFISQRSGKLTLWKYPSIGRLRIGWVLPSATAASSLHLSAQLTNKAGKQVDKIELSHLPGVRGSALMSVKSLEPGNYKLTVRILSSGGVVQKKTFAYDKKPLPKWAGNTLGISNTPPPPWTDVKVDSGSDAIAIWGRNYDYDQHLLPTQIVNQGKSMLTGPMALVVQAAGERPVSSSAAPASTTKWTKQTAARAASVRRQTVGPVQVKIHSYTDFDGMTWMKLTVTPAHGVAQLKNLTFEIPLKKQWAKLINAYDYSLRQTGALPEKGWHGSARPLWLGNGSGGIQYFQQSTANWAGSRSIEVVPEGNSVVMKVHLVDQPLTLNKPRQFSFGWIVSPVKPAPKNYCNWRLMSGHNSDLQRGTGQRGAYLKKAAQFNQNLKPFSVWWQGWWWIPKGYKGSADRSGTLPVPSGNKRCNAIIHSNYGLTIRGCPYGRLSQIGTDNQWFAQFGDEWLADASKVYQPNLSRPAAQRKVTVSQSARSLRDFFAWGYNQLLSQYPVQALYFDVSRPVYDNNIYRSARTTRTVNHPPATYNILAMRKTFKRIYTLMKKYHPDGRIMYHMSGQVLLPIDSFCDVMIDGENYTSLLNRKNHRGYEKVLSLAQFRAEYNAQNNFGPVTGFLPEFGRSGAIKKDEWKKLGYGHAQYLLGLILLHDSNLWWAYFPYNVLTEAYLSLDKIGWDSRWTFLPYWHQKVFNLPKHVVASLYVSPDKSKTVVVVMNVSKQDQPIALSLDKLNKTLDRKLSQLQVLYPDRAVKLVDQTVQLTVPAKNFQMFLLN